MIWIFIFCLIIIIILLEKYLPGMSLNNIQVSRSLDKVLVEPEEEIIMTSKIYNKGIFPIMYACMQTYLPAEAIIDSNNAKNFELLSIEEYNQLTSAMFLTPHMRRNLRYTFSLPMRGLYTFEDYKLTAGDFLGIRDQSEAGTLPVTVVVKPKRCEDKDIKQMLGGFIGEISVRRFIFEDPVMTVGFREYTGHEPFKAISWLQTARTGSLQVKQYDYTTDMKVSVILNAENGTMSSMEQCYEVTRTVCEELESKKIPYDFYTNCDISGPIGQISHVSEGIGPQHLNTILYGLGSAKHHCTRSFADLIKDCINSQNQSSGYVIVSSLLSNQQQDALNRLKAVCTQEICLIICD